jgi:hypothetical protein
MHAYTRTSHAGREGTAHTRCSRKRKPGSPPPPPPARLLLPCSQPAPPRLSVALREAGLQSPCHFSNRRRDPKPPLTERDGGDQRRAENLLSTFSTERIVANQIIGGRIHHFSLLVTRGCFPRVVFWKAMKYILGDRCGGFVK